MLSALITSKTRIKLLLRFFLNSSNTGYLRGLEAEFGESTNAIRLELNRFEEAGLLTASSEGNRKIYRSNTTHPIFTDLNSLVRKYVGMDEIIERVINHLGEPQQVYLMGNLARGLDSNEISLLIVGNDIDLDYLENLVAKAQKIVSRKIRYAVLSTDEFELQQAFLNQDDMLLVWQHTDQE